MIKRLRSPLAILLKASAIVLWWLPSIKAGHTNLTNSRKSSCATLRLRAAFNSSKSASISTCSSAGRESSLSATALMSTLKNYTKIFVLERWGVNSEKSGVCGYPPKRIWELNLFYPLVYYTSLVLSSLVLSNLVLSKKTRLKRIGRI